MDDTQFWSIIESGGPQVLDDPDAQLAAVRAQLLRLTPEQIVEFSCVFNRKLEDAYDWNLWGAGWLINGGCSDDGFVYFRCWLISRGKAVYEAALCDPDTLASIVDPERDDYEFEDLLYVDLHVYEEKTGVEMPALGFRGSDEPKGERWDFEDEEQSARRLPKLDSLYE